MKTNMIKQLIVNADDFGYSPGVNGGIIKAHTAGIVTSTTVLVYSKHAHEAKKLIHDYPNLSVGLHFQLTDEKILQRIKDIANAHLVPKDTIRQELENQIEKFQEITGKMPTHIDGHHHVHRLPRIAPIVKDVAKKYNLPIRNFNGTHFIGTFFAWGDGGIGKAGLHRFQPERVSSKRLIKIMKELPGGVSELMCHPAIVDDELLHISRYAQERAVELEALTSKDVRQTVQDLDIKLINMTQLQR